MLLIIDNYDSFTYNLVQMFARYMPVAVKRNDETDVARIQRLDPQAIVISPGPGRPEDSGCILEVLQEFSASKPIFGVCLGLQALGQACGASVVRAGRQMHGKTSPVYHNSRGLFRGLPNPFSAMRYHSLVVDPETLSPELDVTAYTSQGEIMGLSHRAGLACAVQFHPESILTPQGQMIIENFLAMHQLASGVPA
ncbi:aminodeoxychorismate/anthranilate synthase component II [bacterium]|nr:aminodeoxychorismate/anthranilate synthase component II [bacterium]